MTRISAQAWFDLLLDPEAPREMLGAARCAVSGVLGFIGGFRVTMAAFDFSLFAGTLGVQEGQVLVDCLRLGAEHQGALVIAASGGVRLQEGTPAFLQMARIVAARQQLSERSRPLVVVATDPTMGGVAATLAATADILLAEPQARLAFSGPLTQKAYSSEVRVDVAEEALYHGLVDQVVVREQLRAAIIQCFNLLVDKKAP